MNKSFLLTFLIAACSAAELTPIKKVQPEYPNVGSAYIIDHAEVRLIVAGDGVPFSIESNIGLPEYVVRAMAAWRYQPFASRDRAMIASLDVPIRRALSPGMASKLVVRWTAAPETTEALKRSESLDADDAVTLLSKLPPNEEPELARTSLIAYYAKHPSPEAEQHRAELVLWLIEHYPQADIQGSAYAVLNPGGSSANPEATQKARSLWNAALQQYPADYTVA